MKTQALFGMTTVAIWLLALLGLKSWSVGVQAMESNSDHPPKPIPRKPEDILAAQYETAYQIAFSEFCSDLAPASQTKALNTLISCAVRGHHTDDVARLLVQELRTFPPDVVVAMSSEGQDGWVQLLSMYMTLAAMPYQTLLEMAAKDGDFSAYSLEEQRYWGTIAKGLFLLATQKRMVFVEGMNDPLAPMHVRLVLKSIIAVVDQRTIQMRKAFEQAFPGEFADATEPDNKDRQK